MSETSYLLAVVAIAGAVTWTLRAAPFALLAPLRHSSLLPHLAERMPVGIMAILTIYSLRHVELANAGSIVPAGVGIVITAALHLWRGNMILSLVTGTAAYVVLASTIYAT